MDTYGYQMGMLDHLYICFGNVVPWLLFWELVSSTLTDMLGNVIPRSPVVMLLNDVRIPLLKKKSVVQLKRWQPPHTDIG